VEGLELAEKKDSTKGPLGSLICSLDSYRLGRHRLQDESKVGNELAGLYLAESVRVLLELRERFFELSTGAIPISLGEVMQSDGCLNQTLVKEPQRSPSLPPQVFPCLVGFEIPSVVKKNYSVLQMIGHWTQPVSL